MFGFIMFADNEESGGGGEPSQEGGSEGETSSQGGSEGNSSPQGDVKNPLGGDPEPPKNDEPSEGNSSEKSTKQSIHGDLADKIQWPEGFEQDLKEDPTLKKFVKQDGTIDYANALKSYHHAQKQIGKDKVVIPDEKYATQEDWDAFWTKVGFTKDIDQYQVDPGEDSKLDNEFVEDFKKAAHENRIPQKQAQELLKFFNERTSNHLEKSQQEYNEKINDNIKNLKEQYGSAFEEKTGMAKRLIKDFGDENISNAVKDPAIGSNPDVVKLLVNISEKFYGEDKHVGDTAYTGALSPSEAQERIDAIYGDFSHPYHDSKHPNHKKAQEEMHRLFQYKNSER